MPIIGLTDRGAAFPRIGTLRKGAAKPDGNRPGADLKDHFRFETDDEEARAAFVSAYGDKPNGIRIMFQFQTAAENFETWQEHHSAGALKHRCDGQVCVLTLLPDGTYSHESVPCPSIAMKAANPQIDKKHLCRPVGRLKIVIPELRRMAYVLAPTTSINDILELQANLEAAEAMRGDLRGIPFILSRRPRQVSTPGTNGQRARREKWLLSVEPSPEWVKLQLIAMERAALPMGATPLALPPAGASYVDETTGEIFSSDDDEDEAGQEAVAEIAAGKEQRTYSPPLTTLTGACDLVKPWYSGDGSPRLAFVINSIRVVAAGDLAETWHDLENGETVTIEGDYKEHPQKGQYLAAATIARVAQPVGAEDLF